VVALHSTHSFLSILSRRPSQGPISSVSLSLEPSWGLPLSVWRRLPELLVPVSFFLDSAKNSVISPMKSSPGSLMSLHSVLDFWSPHLSQLQVSLLDSLQKSHFDERKCHRSPSNCGGLRPLDCGGDHSPCPHRAPAGVLLVH
jgi:hypothetical protein